MSNGRFSLAKGRRTFPWACWAGSWRKQASVDGLQSPNSIFDNCIAMPRHVAKVAIMDHSPQKTLSAREAKNRFGYLIDLARQEPISIEKHGRPVVVVVSVEDVDCH
ncbi:type II toxin-antitoxin system prevent-host-death family antitoxin [Aminobacter sp. P9b]|uniref:type II toxin-antitoxin system Phd/YefM family antitoxin n=1 Tax=Aminobacter sp. P9b TaxID=3133697 RepID=UPI00324DE805